MNTWVWLLVRHATFLPLVRGRERKRQNECQACLAVQGQTFSNDRRRALLAEVPAFEVGVDRLKEVARRLFSSRLCDRNLCATCADCRRPWNRDENLFDRRSAKRFDLTLESRVANRDGQEWVVALLFGQTLGLTVVCKLRRRGVGKHWSEEVHARVVGVDVKGKQREEYCEGRTLKEAFVPCLARRRHDLAGWPSRCLWHVLRPWQSRLDATKAMKWVEASCDQFRRLDSETWWRDRLVALPSMVAVFGGCGESDGG